MPHDEVSRASRGDEVIASALEIHTVPAKENTLSEDDFFDRVGTAAKPSRQRGEFAASAPTPSVGMPASTSALGGSITDSSQRRWAANDAIFWASQQTYDKLPAALYRCGRADGVGPILTRTLADTDDLIELPDSASAEAVEEIRTFWTLEDHFRERGFLHKRGVLLYGPPGSGKTATLQLLIGLIVRQHEGIGIFIDEPSTAAACLQMARKVEPKRPIVALLEDLDALIERFGENEYLALLDGEAQVDNIVFVATTNYPERLDRRFVDRPSRFDTIKYVGMPTAAARRIYLLAKEPSLKDDGIDDWVRLSDGFSIAHLREMIILCRCYRKTLEEVVARLEKMRSRKPTSDDFERSGQPLGFLASVR